MRKPTYIPDINPKYGLGVNIKMQIYFQSDFFFSFQSNGFCVYVIEYIEQKESFLFLNQAKVQCNTLGNAAQHNIVGRITNKEFF